jgi:pSer/pThr/pTyr-binding forkhead associated (FHA) protein
MVDELSQKLAQMEDYLQRSIAAQIKLTADDIDAKEICAQLAEQIRLQQYRWADSKYLPHILTVHVLEEKPEKIESLELIFCSTEFGKLLLEAARAAGLESLMPMRAEVEQVKQNHPAIVTNSRRCSVTLTWPKVEDTMALADIVVDQEQRRIISIQVRRANMPVLARLTALNAEVYRNNYLLIRENTHIGRLRVVVDDKTGRFLRRNDYVFAQNDDPEAVCNSVSRQQAKISYGSDGGYYIEDSGSVNSTLIERALSDGGKETIDVKPNRPVRLQHGDLIFFGVAQVRFQLVEHIDPQSLAEIGSEQEKVIARRGERRQNVTMRLPVQKQGD